MPILKMPTVEWFYVEKKGDNPVPILLIHGAGSTHMTWSSELRRLPGYAVLAVDLPGHGRSSGTGFQSIPGYADSVIEWMDAIRCNTAIVVGHSMGGAIAQYLALRYKERVKHLGLVATGPILNVNPQIFEMIENDYERMVEVVNGWMWGKNGDELNKMMNAQQMLSTDPQVMYGDYFACDRFDVRDQLHSITQPTLIIGGGQDKMTPFKLSKALDEGIPNTTLVQIENAGHMITLEHPKAIANIVQDWLSR
ncbi:MAG: alpha/beta hydrolase [Chloroflexi bacterium]|nr:alpha/beta hydrolase [Chloroflexota bacterium]